MAKKLMAAALALAASAVLAGGAAAQEKPAAPAAPAATTAPAKPAHPAAAKPNPAEGIPAAVVDDRTVETIIGRQVLSPTGDDMGPIVNMFVDGQGHVRAALIDFGGFLGVGSRRVAVDWQALKFAADGKDNKITCTLTKNQIRLAPAYKEGQPLVVLGSPPPAPAPAEKPAAAPNGKSAAPTKPPPSPPEK